MSALPLLLSSSPGARVAWWLGRTIIREVFLSHVQQTAARLPEHRFAINLCEDRYLFLVAFAAVMTRGQTNLLPPSRANKEVQGIADAYPDSYRLTDDVVKQSVTAAPSGVALEVPAIPAGHVAAVAFTSGSTGRSRPHPKRWSDLVTGTRLAEARFGFASLPNATLVATVPPQHMYGLETSILLPLVSGVSVHGSRPFFPADLHAVLTVVPQPGVLITTPAHLRVCTEAKLTWPQIAFIISATAPLDVNLAARAEQVFRAPVLEIYGCTEAGSMASRRTTAGDRWRLYDGMWTDGDRVYGSHLPEPVPLNDVVELTDHTQFRLLGRQEDMVNIAGKRASLADLNQRLNAIEGVSDGVFVMLDEETAKITRLAALVVAPALNERAILAALAERVDPAFLPRPLYKVEQLPRNETGKLPRKELLALLAEVKRQRAAKIP